MVFLCSTESWQTDGEEVEPAGLLKAVSDGDSGTDRPWTHLPLQGDALS